MLVSRYEDDVFKIGASLAGIGLIIMLCGKRSVAIWGCLVWTVGAGIVVWLWTRKRDT